MRHPWQTWLTFALCLLVVLAAMGWMSLTALRLDRARALAHQQAAVEENVRLALWRMDSSVSPLIARENARPYFAYSPFYPAGRAYTRMFAEIESGEVLLPSPLLTELPPGVVLHFQFEPDGSLSSPQVPTGNMRDLAEARYTNQERITQAADRLAKLRELVKGDVLLAHLKAPTLEVSAAIRIQEGAPGPPPRVSQYDQVARSNVEWNARQQEQQKAQVTAQNESANPALLNTKVSDDLMKPVWIHGVLLLARNVTVDSRSYIQGCWVDWPGLRQSLLDGVKDLLPAAKLEPVTTGLRDKAERQLAALPVRLLPGEFPAGDGNGPSPIVLSLAVAWVCVLLAAGAVVMLLVGAVSLSERRGAFVSSVTHELRTPLTTFRMYTEMLEADMVKDESKEKQYLKTLRTEAERLGHLVENVLAYARLESGRARGRIETVTLDELVDTSRELLSARAKQSGMELVVELDEDAAKTPVRADTAAVEQILFNLVDNACKYAASASDRRIHVKPGRKDGGGVIRVCDHGPGIPRTEARRLFRPFRKSARDAANSAPGVGLGLALSKRLARQMNGELHLDSSVPSGACFVLELPSA